MLRRSKDKKVGIFIPMGRKPWPHEMHAAEVLATAGHYVEFLSEGHIHSADILLDGVEYEIKSPESSRAITIERAIKKALRQSNNLIIDMSRMKGVKENRVQAILVAQARSRKQIKKMLFITRQGKVIDILELF